MSADSLAATFPNLTDLAAASIGGKVLGCSDDFFASAPSLLEAGRGVFIPDRYTDRGKWMDGWESRRKRVPGHDWCVIALGAAGAIRGVDIDTNHFLGNHPPWASVQACHCAGQVTLQALLDEVAWTEIVPQVGLQRGSQNVFATTAPGAFTHVRLRIYPDGGVARFRVYGEPSLPATDVRLDLAALANGGRAVGCNDMFFSPMSNLIAPGASETMGGGWETRRRREPGNDWIIVRLCAPGSVDAIEIDTNHFKGNFPDRCAVDGIHWRQAPPASLVASPDWTEILPPAKLHAHQTQRFEEIAESGPFTHVRLRIFPCGGVSRLRVYGAVTSVSPDDQGVDALNALTEAAATAALSRCCVATRWVGAMAARRPFASRAELFGHAQDVWWGLSGRDWQQAFSGHPEIGSDVDSLRDRFAGAADLAAAEQSGVQAASEETLQALAAANRQYADTFGFIFIVCATGRSASQMLEILLSRMGNSASDELAIAAGEQAKITRLRLAALVASR